MMTESPLRFDEIYEAFEPRIRRYLTRLVGENEAQDLTQEVFFKVSQGLGSLRQESKLSTWIYRIARNTALDRVRSPAFQDSARQALSNDVAMDAVEPPVEQRLIQREMNECIRGFIKDLPAEYRSVLVLGELDELPDRQVAERLGVSLPPVKVRLHRGRKRLRGDLGKHCNFYRNTQNELACEPKSALA
jgi:RNA polymerase sigma-70 factor (ECF subfamily)